MRPLLRVLVIGFAAVIVLLTAAAIISLRNAHSVAGAATDLVSDQLVTARLLDEVEREQEVLNAAFYRLSRAPDVVDRERVLADLDKTGDQIRQLVAQEKSGPDAPTWNDLERAVGDFSQEARQLLLRRKVPIYSSRDLFFLHEQVTTAVARLVDRSLARAVQLNQRVQLQSVALTEQSTMLVSGGLLVALASAIMTVILAIKVFRQMESDTSELGRVSFRMLETQEATARRFAHELHDELGGSLTAIKSNLAAISANPSDPGRIEDCAKLVEEAISNVRELSQLLRPTILDDFGLDASLRWLTARFRERTGIAVEYRSEFDGRLADETETHLFRIVQEALTNVARHSGATKVSIHLRAEDSIVRLTLSDNGKGLEKSRRVGMGLVGMQARARSAGGELRLSSEPGSGVTIEAWAPREAA